MLLPHWCKTSSLYLVPIPNYWIWTKTTPQKMWFFRSNLYKIEVVIKLKLSYQTLVTWTHLQYNLNQVIKFSVNVIDRNYDVITFISKYHYFRKTIFADIIKTVTRFIKKMFKDSRKIKRIRNYVSKCNLYLYFLI